MSREQPPLTVKVWGELACFSRPELKVDRVTYPVMTPSAARGLLEAIFWRKAFRWRIEAIQVLKGIQYFSMVRNEVTERTTEDRARRWAREGGGFDASSKDNRTQRHTLGLRDVAYIILAQIELRPDATDDVAKYRDQFRRRVRTGRYYAAPYLGCREFAASFAEPEGDEEPIQRTEDLGLMLLDMEYPNLASGRGKARFFQARLDRGVLRVDSPQEWE